jgi:hypothetical protein
MRDTSKDVFYLQTDLIDMKVNMAASQAIDRVIEQIQTLKTDMHAFRDEVNLRFTEVGNRIASLSERVVAIETRLGMVTQTRNEIRSRVIDYCFKAGWLLLASVVSYFSLILIK